MKRVPDIPSKSFKADVWLISQLDEYFAVAGVDVTFPSLGEYFRRGGANSEMICFYRANQRVSKELLDGCT